jgi:hypothetical protein
MLFNRPIVRIEVGKRLRNVRAFWIGLNCTSDH